MPVQLTPGLLSVYQQIEHDDQHAKLLINNRIAPLSPSEYALTVALLRQRRQWEETGGQAILCMGVALLMKTTGVGPRGVLLRHLSNASMKLIPLGIHLVNARSYGYLILFASEIAAPTV